MLVVNALHLRLCYSINKRKPYIKWITPKTKVFRTPLPSLCADRIIEIYQLYKFGIEVFGTEGFNKWLNSDIVALDNKVPVTLLNNSQGINLIRTKLGRIQHGVLALSYTDWPQKNSKAICPEKELPYGVNGGNRLVSLCFIQGQSRALSNLELMFHITFCFTCFIEAWVVLLKIE